ncbi:hypothetical protein PCPL58_0358 [Pseudomonas cerasi]|uniref:Uncharacterized protein n=1 Tax=Pseudomonas cerasi TaxID=1583341 RepID=A0A193SIC0_9PSED|nr:hypothetical protein PCPL58_0358 [Pseudomonas cerasi]SOS16016.1 hypothetical protein PL963_00917 [Pseudomonas cerasi]
MVRHSSVVIIKFNERASGLSLGRDLHVPITVDTCKSLLGTWICDQSSLL